MKSINLKNLIFHLIIVWGATFFGAFIVGFVSAVSGSQENQFAFAITNTLIVFLSVFFITKRDKISWPHYAALMTALFLTSLLNTFFGVSLLQTIIGVAFLSIIGAIAKFSADLMSKK